MLAASFRPMPAPPAAASMTPEYSRGMSSLAPSAVADCSRLGVHDLGHDQGRGRRHDAGGQEVAGVDAQAHVGRHDAAGDGREAGGHHGHQLGVGHGLDVGADHQRRLGLAHEDVGGGRQGLRAAGLHGAAHDPGDARDHALHDPEVVEDGHQAGEEDHRRQDVDREDDAQGHQLARGGVGDLDETALGPRLQELHHVGVAAEEVAEQEGGAGVGEAQHAGDADARALEDRAAPGRAQQQQGEGELQGQAPAHDAPAHAAATVAEDQPQPHQHEHAQQGNQVRQSHARLRFEVAGSVRRNAHPASSPNCTRVRPGRRLPGPPRPVRVAG